MALTANTLRDFYTGYFQQYQDYEITNAVKIYAGAALGEAADGRARPLAAGDAFLGFAEQERDIPAVAGELEVRAQSKGQVDLVVGGVTALTDANTPVYASDDGTFTLTSTGNSQIGAIVRVKDVASGLCVVAFQSEAHRAK